jgi:hypothetical protein
MFSEKPPKNDVKPETHCPSGNLAGTTQAEYKNTENKQGNINSGFYCTCQFNYMPMLQFKTSNITLQIIEMH